MKIYDATGRLIKNLSLPTAFSTLPTSFTWDGTDDRGVHVPEGIYFATFETDTYKMIKKIILIK
jgi:flagellar hook assembly protein FlgD